MLEHFPWATFGRRESAQEFFAKCESLKDRLLMLNPPLELSLIVLDESANEPQRDRCKLALQRQVLPLAELHWTTSRESAQAALRKSRAEWVGVIDARDVLSPAAGFFLSRAVHDQPDLDLLYTNEVQGDRFISKGPFSAFNLLHYNAIGRFWIARRELLRDGLQDEYRFWRADADLLRARHLPEYLYYTDATRPLETNSAASKQYPSLRNESQLTVIIPFKNRSSLTLRACESVVKLSSTVPMEILLVDNLSVPAERAIVQKEIANIEFARIVDFKRPFNYSELHNEVIRKEARGDLLLFLNNDVLLDSTCSLDTLCAWAAEPNVGTVGIRLNYPDGQLQHAGMRARFGGEARLVRVGNNQHDDRFASIPHEVISNSFAACLTKRSTFNAIGGLRALDYPNGFSDTAYNFECIRRGLKNLYFGNFTGVHEESASRLGSYEYWEERQIEREYPDILQRMLSQDVGENLVPRVPPVRSAVGSYVVSRYPTLKAYLQRLVSRRIN